MRATMGEKPDSRSKLRFFANVKHPIVYSLCSKTLTFGMSGRISIFNFLPHVESSHLLPRISVVRKTLLSVKFRPAGRTQ